MARAHNPFAPKERSKLETPWGVFEVASPNKSRLEAVAAVQREAEQVGDGVEALPHLASIAIRTASACLDKGDEFERAATAAWDADEVELAQLQGAATFVGEEMQAGAAEGND
jgi:hypothetical protein